MIQIFFAIDENYMAPLCVAIKSLISNSDSNKTYQITVINQGLKSDSIETISAMATDNVAINFTSISEKLNAQVGTGSAALPNYFTLTIFYRLFIADMFPDIDKAIYLDADVVCTTDIAELYATDVNKAFVAAAQDPFIPTHKQFAAYATQAIGIPADECVNSGVLVLNLKAMRAAHFSEHFLSLFNQYHFTCVAPDQDYLNAIANKRIVMLSSDWNAQAPGIANPKLVHYNFFRKPWHYKDAEYGDYFWHYAQQTVMYNQLRTVQAMYSPAEVARDDARMDGIKHTVEQAVQQRTVTLASVQQQTGGVRL